MTARALVLSLLVALPVLGVGSSPRTLRADGAAPATYSVAELNELVGPVALYPDVVLAALLPATTVPNDLAAAAKYVGEQGGKATAPPAGVTWDTSVMGLMAYPAVLAWLSSNPDWVKQMAFAMTAQQADVLAAIQVFRATAQSAGNLTSNEQQTVSTQDVDGGSTEVIVIEPTNPEVVYVPTYSPTAVAQPGYTGWAWGAGFVAGATTAAIYNNNNSVNWGNSGSVYVNTGNINTGNINTGNINTGNVNTGNVNTGNVNTGNVNTGNVNKGNVNTGNVNTGNVNTGNANRGNVNTGNANAGNANAGNANAGNANKGNASTASGMGPNRGSQWQAPGAATKPAGGATGAAQNPAGARPPTAPSAGGAAQRPPATKPSAAPTSPSSGFGGSGSGSQARAQSSRGADSLKQSGGGASGGSYKGQAGRSGGSASSGGGGRSGGGGGRRR